MRRSADRQPRGSAIAQQQSQGRKIAEGEAEPTMIESGVNSGYFLTFEHS
jgi:hypothetical protein